MRTETIVPVTGFNALVSSAYRIVTVTLADVMLAPVTIVVISAVTPCFIRPLSVVASSAILTRVVDMTAVVLLTVFAGEVFMTLAHVAVSLVDTCAVIQAGHAILTSSRVRLTVDQA